VADFTQSLASTILFFGEQPSTKWSAPMKWGTDLWGNGGNTNFNMPTDAVTVNLDALPLSSTSSDVSFDTVSVGNNTVTFVQGGIDEHLGDGSGHYLLVLPGGVTNDEYAVTPTYVQSTNAAQTWATSTTGIISWSTST